MNLTAKRSGGHPTAYAKNHNSKMSEDLTFLTLRQR